MTQLFLRSTGPEGGTNAEHQRNGEVYTRLNGTANCAWNALNLSTSRGSGMVNATASTVAGTTPGIEFLNGTNTVRTWHSPPIASAVTISGAITFNLWAFESAMNANAAINVRLYVWKYDGTVSLVHTTVRSTELGTSAAVQNWNETPTSFSLVPGDRLVVVPFIDDGGGTMGSGFTVTLDFSAGSAAADGDSYIDTTETLSFHSSDPSGTTIYPTDSAASESINPGSATEKEAWTSRGAGVVSVVTNTAAGPTSKIQLTDSGGGTALEWYTRPLSAFTLSGPVMVNHRARQSSGSATCTMLCEIAIVDNDGTNPVVWGLNGWGQASGFELNPTTETAGAHYVVGPDTAITDGKRLRIRFFIDDVAGSAGAILMSAASTATFYYAGTSGGASGDTFLTFGQTLTEFVASDPVPKHLIYPRSAIATAAVRRT